MYKSVLGKINKLQKKSIAKLISTVPDSNVISDLLQQCTQNSHHYIVSLNGSQD